MGIKAREKPDQTVTKLHRPRQQPPGLSNFPIQCCSQKVKYCLRTALPDVIDKSPGGGQPTDYGTLTPLNNASEPIRVTNIQREGLHCICHSPQPLEPGTLVRQEVDYERRLHHMQQHTGQHLLSAIIDTNLGLKTVGWGMGRENEPNYVDLTSTPSPEEIQSMQEKCNEAIRQNIQVAVETPESANVSKLPDDYDQEKGIIRVIRIGDLDRNTYDILVQS
jgi:misacylated tRNA(Ala) deacylase